MIFFYLLWVLVGLNIYIVCECMGIWRVVLGGVGEWYVNVLEWWVFGVIEVLWLF